jgi:hypothetical protein
MIGSAIFTLRDGIVCASIFMLGSAMLTDELFSMPTPADSPMVPETCEACCCSASAIRNRVYSAFSTAGEVTFRVISGVMIAKGLLIDGLCEIC